MPGLPLSMPASLMLPMEAAMLVSTAPGAMALQRIPSRAYWNAVFLVNPITACLEAARPIIKA